MSSKVEVALDDRDADEAGDMFSTLTPFDGWLYPRCRHNEA